MPERASAAIDASRPLRVIVTGANGFVGSALMRFLAAQPATEAVGLVRDAAPAPTGGGMPRFVAVGDIHEATDWGSSLRGADVVVHLAARVHVMRDGAADPLAAFRRVNVAGTRRLAEEAVLCGVRRLVLLSSVKVHGEQTLPGQPFRVEDAPNPIDPYGVSKWEAERALQEVARSSGLEVTVLRPPLIYGPGVRANFERMMRWVAKGAPLPLGAVDNQRSMIGLHNLCDLIHRCTWHPAAANRTFLVSDVDVSTPDLLRRIGEALGRPARLIPVPERALRAMLGAMGASDLALRLCGSLQVDAGPARELLGWSPGTSMGEELRTAAEALRLRAGAAR